MRQLGLLREKLAEVVSDPSHDPAGGIVAHIKDLELVVACARGLFLFVIVRLILGVFGMDLYEIYWWFAIGLTIAIFNIGRAAEEKTSLLSGSPMQTDRNPAISIVVLTYKRRPLVEKLLLDLNALLYRPIELILVDNHSQDGTRQMVMENFSSVTYLATGTNLGAVARNMGLAAASGEILVTLDDDIFGLDDAGLAKITSLFSSDPGPWRRQFSGYWRQDGRGMQLGPPLPAGSL